MTLRYESLEVSTGVVRDRTLDVATHELRPHDVVVLAPRGALDAGVEVALVADPAGRPFPADRRNAILHVFGVGAEDGTYHQDARWRIVRRILDDCRSCFLFHASRGPSAGGG